MNTRLLKWGRQKAITSIKRGRAIWCFSQDGILECGIASHGRLTIGKFDGRSFTRFSRSK